MPGHEILSRTLKAISPTYQGLSNLAEGVSQVLPKVAGTVMYQYDQEKKKLKDEGLFDVEGALKAGGTVEGIREHLQKTGRRPMTPLPGDPVEPPLLDREGRTIIPEQTDTKAITASTEGIALPDAVRISRAKKELEDRMSLGSTLENLIGGLAKSAGSTIYGAGQLGGKIFKPAVDFLAGRETDVGRRLPVIEELLEPKPGEAGFKLAGDIAQFLIPYGGLVKAGKTFQAIPAVQKASPFIRGVVGLLPEAFGMGAIEAMQSGREEPKEIAYRSSLTASLPFLFKGLGTVIDKIGNKVLSRLAKSTPKQKALDIAKGVDVGKGISEAGVTFTQGGLIKKLESAKKVLSSQIDDLVEAAYKANPRKAYKMVDLADDVGKRITNMEGLNAILGATPIDEDAAKAAIGKTLTRYSNKYAGEKLTLPMLQKLKKDIGMGLQRAYEQAVGAVKKAQPFAEMQLRKVLQETIEKEVPGIAKENKVLANILTALKRATAKGPYATGLTDVIAGTAGGIYGASTGPSPMQDPIGFTSNILWNALYGLLIKAGMTSHAAKSFIGNMMKESGKIISHPATYQGARETYDFYTEKPRQLPSSP